MKKQKKNDKQSLKNSKGITLIALVISIIVMLILAGVSLNAVVGQNGVLTQAQNAVIANRKAEILEELNLKLTEYNINSFIDAEVGTKQMLGELKNGGYIDEILNSSGYSDNADLALPVPRYEGDDDNLKFTGEYIYGVRKEGYGINIYTANDGIYKAEYGNISFSNGGSVQEGTVLVTTESFNSESTDADGNPLPPEDIGKYTIPEGTNSNIIFIDPVEGQLSFNVEKNAVATINIFNTMTLANDGVDRSAINIEPGGTLNICLENNAILTVDSGKGKNAVGNVPGAGGYAGIHVPWIDENEDLLRDVGEYAILNISGNGTIYAYGGKAGNGANGSLGAGGGGAGAGIGGHGGSGSAGEGGGAANLGDPVAPDGGSGEDCGTINIKGNVIVYAYGGKGGSGGAPHYSAGSGGGGYPGAGIGGGGAGGAGATCCTGAGGYSGGSGPKGYIGINGMSGGSYQRSGYVWSGDDNSGRWRKRRWLL